MASPITDSPFPTAAEKPVVAKLRARIGSEYPQCDPLLLIWLRARDMDVDKAEQMLRKSLIWRKNNEVYKLKEWKSPKCFLPYIHTGYDLQRYPVFILPIGRWDLRGLIERGDMLCSLKFIYQCLEVVGMTAIKQNIYQGVVICDFDGFSYRQIAHRTVVQGMIEMMRVFEANYPESLKACYIINAPKIFPIVFSIIKPFLHSRTLSKIQIFGPDREKWQNVIFKTMARDQLPPYWGGTKQGVDEYCSNDWFLEPLPPHFLRKSSVHLDDFGDEWYSIRVAAKEQLTMDYVVEKGKEYKLHWRFKTDGYDIGFSISHTEEDEFLIPYKRVQSHLEKVEGDLVLKQSGTYRMTFDNSYSRSRVKIIHYCISFVSLDQIDSMPGLKSTRDLVLGDESFQAVFVNKESEPDSTKD